ncbi:MAG: helix-turn-helix transcriptional regulator [Magnetovibrio sp.]|nr:helix-turn-helix transcriptional regulator [Magnetovibrio sp.]
MPKQRPISSIPGVILDTRDIPRSVVIRPKFIERGDDGPVHHHNREQLVYADRGVMLVSTDSGSWVVPPNRAVWVPSKMDHGVKTITDCRMLNVFFDPGLLAKLPKTCSVVSVPPLLQELLRHASTFPDLYDEDGPEGRVIDVIVDSVQSLDTVPLHLPMPTDKRLRRVAEAIIADPADKRSQTDWAKTCGASVRTLARLFPEQTGMTFSAWRQQARLMAALERLAAGEAVVSIALDLGYASQSAFITMFKKALGTTPGKYFSN